MLRMNVFVVVVLIVFQAVGHIAQVVHIVVVAEDAGTIVVVLIHNAQLAGNVQIAVLMVDLIQAVEADQVLMNVLVMLVAILYLVEDIVQPVLEIMYIVQIVEYVLIMDMIIVM